MKDKHKKSSVSKTLFGLAFILTGLVTNAQDIPVFGWQSHFSYNNITQVIATSDQLIASTSAAAYYIDFDDQSTNFLNRNTGLSDIGIGALAISDNGQIVAFGYTNGNIDLLQNGVITNINDILEADNISEKRINSIGFEGSELWIATDFGMVRYSLSQGVILEAYQNIGVEGARVAINDFILTADSIYASSADGILSVSLDEETNRQDFNFWQRQLLGINFELIETTNEGLIASAGTDIFQLNAGQWEFLVNFEAPIRALEFSNGQTFILTENKLNLLSNGVSQTILTAEENQTFTSISFQGSQTFIGTEEQGILAYNGLSTELSIILPSGPQSDKNLMSSVASDMIYWLSDEAVSVFEPDQIQWNSIDIIEQNAGPINSLNDFSFSVFNSISSFDQGLFIEVENGFESIETFSSQHTLEQNNGSYRLSAIVQNEADLWLVQNGLTFQLNRWNQTTDDWQAYRLSHPQSNFLTGLYLINNNDKWMPVQDNRGGGVLVFNEEINRERYLNTNGGQGGLPGSLITDVAQDQDQFIWVATDEGICFFPSPNQILTNIALTASIPIYDGGLLLRDEHITSIAIDPANRKWFGTIDDGVWLFSETGEELIQHFTQENSPLPSNQIIDISIDESSGIVYFTTESGIASFRSDATRGTDTHINVKVYPNPVEPNFNGLVVIEELVNNAQIRLTDVSGKLVRSFNANGSTATWNLRDERGARVSSGVYLIFSSNEDGSETYVGKIVVI